MFNRFNAPQILVSSFLMLILSGTVLLLTPWATGGNGTDFVTALFTSASAVCVTGLVVVDTGTYWTFFGQMVILLLIQAGGLGIMSFATFYALLLGKKIMLRQRLIMQEALNKSSLEGIVNVFRILLIFSFAIEFLAGICLAIHLHFKYGYEPLKAFWFGIFHAVSAFNNAGFDLFGNYTSLTKFTSDPLFDFLIAFLIIIGGLGFVVIYELMDYRKNGRLSLHARIVIRMTMILVGFSTLIIFVTEYNHALQGFSLGTKISASFFQAVTPRTAGFNTLNMNSLLVSTQFLIILLMFIGGSPGSTAGGVKTSTLSVVWLMVVNQIKGRKTASILERQIDNQNVLRALTIIILALSFVIVVTFLMCLTQEAELMEILFEVVSAMGTVGLSLGLTLKLNLVGKLLIIITMFLGRVGPLTLVLALANRREQPEMQYPEDKIMLG